MYRLAGVGRSRQCANHSLRAGLAHPLFVPASPIAHVERAGALRIFAQILSSFRARAARRAAHDRTSFEWEPLPQPESVRRDPRHVARTIRYIHLNPCRDAHLRAPGRHQRAPDRHLRAQVDISACRLGNDGVRHEDRPPGPRTSSCAPRNAWNSSELVHVRGDGFADARKTSEVTRVITGATANARVTSIPSHLRRQPRFGARCADLPGATVTPPATPPRPSPPPAASAAPAPAPPLPPATAHRSPR